MYINNFYVYVWIRKDLNVIFYVGKGSKNRYKDLRMRNKHTLNVVNSVGIQNIEFKIIEDNLSEQESFDREVFYIKKYRDSENSDKLTNISNGVDGSSGWFNNISVEEQEKHIEISKSFLGRTHTEETKQKMSASMKGAHKMSDEGKRKLSEIRKGSVGYWKRLGH